jgi:Holliday junction resolvase
MAQTPEKKVKNACVAVLIKHGAYYFFAPANGYGRAGIPDIIVCHKGKFLAIECKAGYNKTTLLQEREIVNIHKAGGAAMVVREDTIDALEKWFEEER